MVNAEGKLTKIFSYDCPFCFKYDVGVDPKVLPRIEKELGLAFNPVHLETKGKYGRVASEFLAMCMLKDKAAGVSIESKDSLFKKAKDAIYQAYHKKGERWTSGEALTNSTRRKTTKPSRLCAPNGRPPTTWPRSRVSRLMSSTASI